MRFAKGVPEAAAAVASIADELTDHDLDAVVGGLARALVEEPALAALQATSSPRPLTALAADALLEPTPA